MQQHSAIGNVDDFPEKHDPQVERSILIRKGTLELMVLYSSHELEADPEEIMRFWSRMLHRQCQQKNTLIIHMCPIIRDFTLYGIVPTSFELSIPRLMKDGRVLSASQVRQAHHTQHTGASSSSSSSAAATSLSQLLSYYMSSTFSITTSPQQQLDEVLSDGILLTSVLLTLEKHLVLHTNSLAPKARVHFMPASYVNSSLAQYMRETSTKTHMASGAASAAAGGGGRGGDQDSAALLSTLLWDDILLLLRFMQKNGTVVISEDSTVIKFLSSQDSLPVTTSSSSGPVWRALQYLTSTDTSIPSVAAAAVGCITTEDTWSLRIARSMTTLSTRVQALEEQMAKHRKQAALYKRGSDVHMAKLMLTKLLNTRKQRDSTAAALATLEELEQNVEECDTQKEIISSYQLATQALKQARVITTTQTETRTITTPHADGTTSRRTEEVVVGVSVKELTVEAVEEAMMAFEEEAEIVTEISDVLAGGSGSDSTSEDMTELEAQLEALMVEERGQDQVQEKEQKQQGARVTAGKKSQEQVASGVVASSGNSGNLVFPTAPTHRPVPVPVPVPTSAAVSAATTNRQATSLI